mgnify:CR=1 FL=1
MDSMTVPQEEDTEFELTGGALCLDFANTLGDRPRSINEHLKTYGDLLRFSRQADSLSVGELKELERLEDKCDGCVDPIFKKVIELRETIFRIFSEVARGGTPTPEDIDHLNNVLQKAMRQLEIRKGEEGFGWAWGGPAQALDRPLWPIARSAADLLTSGDLGCIRECASETCSWLFMDCSRNQRRRWCDMSTCGNRAKARRHYQRRKQQV